MMGRNTAKHRGKILLKSYNTFRDEMILRDYLALDRTILANERTLLAYLRTFIGTFSAGIAMTRFLDILLTDIIGYIFVIVSPLFVIFGVIRYFRISNKLKALNQTAKKEKTSS